MDTPLFNRQPGAHERHLQRVHDNPLFPEARRRITEADVMQARRRDQQQLESFMEHFHKVVQRAAELDGNAQSDVILDIKEELDRCYETCSGLAGDQSQIKQAIARLVETIMRAVRKGAEHDAVALKKLDEEDQARSLHYELLETPLVADLLNPDRVVPEPDLVPTLLGAEHDALERIMALFTPEQVSAVILDARQLLQTSPADAATLERARRNLTIMEAAATEYAGTHTVN